MSEPFWIWNSDVSIDYEGEEKKIVVALESTVQAVVEGLRLFPGLSLVGKTPFTMQIAPDVHMSGVLGLPSQRDNARLLVGLLAKYPLTYDEVRDAHLDGAVEVSRLLGVPSETLQVAFSADSPLLSLNIAPWSSSSISVARREVIEDGSIRDELSDVRNVAHLEHLPHHEAWFIAQEGDEMDASGLWARRNELFPHVDFLPSVERLLLSLGVKEFRAVYHRLHELESATAVWDIATSQAPAWMSFVSPESESRLKYCYFDVGPNLLLFSLHARYTPTEGRIHFRLLPAETKILVGYVGIKLGI